MKFNCDFSSPPSFYECARVSEVLCPSRVLSFLIMVTIPASFPATHFILGIGNGDQADTNVRVKFRRNAP